MVGMLLFLPEQCEPMDEFMTLMNYAAQEIQDSRMTEYLGRGGLGQEVLEHHQFILEEMLYPMIDQCNPIQLYVEFTKYHVEIRLR